MKQLVEDYQGALKSIWIDTFLKNVKEVIDLYKEDYPKFYERGAWEGSGIDLPYGWDDDDIDYLSPAIALFMINHPRRSEGLEGFEIYDGDGFEERTFENVYEAIKSLTTTDEFAPSQLDKTDYVDD